MSRQRAGADEVARRRQTKIDRANRTVADNLGVPDKVAIKRIARYGVHEDAALVIELDNGAELRFERQADLFTPTIVMRRAAIAGCDIKHLSAPATLALAKQILAQAELVAEHAARADHREVLRRMLTAFENAGTPTSGNLADKQVRYERFCALRDHAPVDDGNTPPVALAIVLTDLDPEHAGDRYLRVHDVARALRHERKAGLSWPTLHSLVIEAGWQHPGELWQRKPKGQARARVNVYIAPAGWEFSDLPDSDSDTDAENQ